MWFEFLFLFFKMKIFLNLPVLADFNFNLHSFDVLKLNHLPSKKVTQCEN